MFSKVQRFIGGVPEPGSAENLIARITEGIVLVAFTGVRLVGTLIASAAICVVAGAVYYVMWERPVMGPSFKKKGWERSANRWIEEVLPRAGC
jgi:hypothetical protein